MRTVLPRSIVSYTALLLSLGACAPREPGPNLLRNGSFEEGTEGWTFSTLGDGASSPAVEDGALVVGISNPGLSVPDVAMGQQGFALEHGAWYELSYRAAGDGVSELTVAVRSTELPGPGKPYAPPRPQALTATMTRYTRTFLMAYPAEAGAGLELLLGGRGAGTIRLDDLSLRKVRGGGGRTEREIEYPKVTPQVDRENLVVYEIVPPSYDGGPWEGGDSFRGILAKLDRIQELGVNVLWLGPVFDGTGMGYWTRDYYAVNPNLGTRNELAELVHEAHRRDMLVILDFVPNHTWTQHPFFQDVLQRHEASEYADYYYWEGRPGASRFRREYDWDTLPDVNIGNPEVLEYMLQVAAHWVKELDVDGYRVDCAWALEERSPSFPGFGGELRARLESVKPGVFLLGEGNVNEPRFLAYDGAYDWDLRGWYPPGALPEALEGVIGPEQLHAALTRELPRALPLRFAENHDHPRAATLWGMAGSRLAHTIVLTSRGYPLVFGGGEVGFAPPVGRQNDPVRWDYRSPLFAYVKKLVAIRRQYLRNELTQRWVPNDAAPVYSSLSIAGSNRVLTVANFSSAPVTVTLTLAEELGPIASIGDLLRDLEVPYDGGGSLTLSLEGQGTAVLLIE